MSGANKSRGKSREWQAGRNGGKLLKGGTNRGAGRPPSAIRAALAVSFDERRHILESLADDPSLTPTERLKALDLMGKYGVGSRQDHTSADARLEPVALHVTYDNDDDSAG